ncbi:MAG: type II secretion system F family protein [Acidobacteria bacterium]|nr:type II secretion system F family protein [Acidobacteriota bacterium]MBI1983718.1 type II secretion system F family protein [Acidobacteriota bacterium]
MPQYEFRGTSRTGEQVTGTRAAPNREALDAVLRREQITPTRIVEKGREIAIPKPKVVGKVSAKELAIFTRQFSVMIDAGLPLVQCLEILATQQENKAFAKVLAGVRSSVESGSTLANALRQYPKIFDDLYTNMVEAGETGGILDTILQRLSTYIEKAVKLKRAVQSALIYPVAVLVIAGGVIFLLLWQVVPIFATLFAGLGVALPLPTRIVIGASTAIGTFAIPMFILIGFGGWGLKAYYATPNGRMMIDSIVLKLPLLGSLMRKIGVARFTRTLGTLITSGVPMLEAMDITARTSGNAVIEKAILSVRKAIEEGRTIVDPLRETGVFPNMVVQMIGVGEQTGALDAMLQKIADFYEDEVDAAVGDLLTAMEPAIILVLGVVVGGVVISMYLPLFELIGKLAG